MDTNRTITQIALALYSSAKRTERLPKIQTWNPSQRVQIVKTTLTDSHDRGSALSAGDYL